ncbi:MAG: response regulator transcription factor [Clostridiales bacterium]|jgi:DNA-binding response OmpR family regulator|nr:response regulator transcription factor [Clostridiales bacterium]
MRLKHKILIVDDDPQILESLRIFLSAEYIPVLAANGREAIAALEEHPDTRLILMDSMMPQMSGPEAIAQIRRENAIPIIILSAKTEDADIITGLEIGADDYVKKPFNLVELNARVRSHLRRYTLYGADTDLPGEDVISLGGLSLNKTTKEVLLDERDVHLTPIEFRILELLLESPGKVFTIKEIYREVWGARPVGSDNTVSVHIRRIREKIEINPAEPMYLKVVWGVGYKVEKP